MLVSIVHAAALEWMKPEITVNRNLCLTDDLMMSLGFAAWEGTRCEVESILM